eukprot:747539-Hanusia_phi.AAC.3
MASGATCSNVLVTSVFVLKYLPGGSPASSTQPGSFSDASLSCSWLWPPCPTRSCWQRYTSLIRPKEFSLACVALVLLLLLAMVLGTDTGRRAGGGEDSEGEGGAARRGDSEGRREDTNEQE